MQYASDSNTLRTYLDSFSGYDKPVTSSSDMHAVQLGLDMVHM